MTSAPESLSPPRPIPALLLSLVVFFWQLAFFLDAPRLSTDYHDQTALGMCSDLRAFFPYFYYFDQLPVGAISVDPPPSPLSQRAALRFLERSGYLLRMDFSGPCNTARYGDLGKIFLFWPAAWLWGGPAHLTVVPANALLFVVGLLAVVVGFWRSGYSALGLLIVLLVGSDPFQLLEVYANENVFSFPISTTLLILGTHVRMMARGGTIDRWAWVTAALTGAFLASVREVRTDSALMALAVPGIYLTVGGESRRRKLALVAVFAASLLLTAQLWKGYFDSKFIEAQRFVRLVGGQPYTGPRSQHHAAWHNVFLGLGDFDTRKGYRWDDKLAYAYAIPILRSRYHLNFTYAGGYYFEETHDTAGEYPISPQDFSRYHEVIREKVIGDVMADPAWYLGILGKRFLAIMSQTTPIGVGYGASWWGAPFSGWFIVPTLIAVGVLRRAFLAKLLVFSFPLSLSPLVVYCGPGSTYYAIFHILTLCVWLQLLLEALHRSRESRVTPRSESHGVAETRSPTLRPSCATRLPAQGCAFGAGHHSL